MWPGNLHIDTQVALLKVYDPLLQGESLRGTLWQSSMALEEGESGPDSGEGEAGIPLRSPGLVRVKAQGLPTAVPSPVSCRGWDLASCLSFPALPSLLLVLFPSPSLIADQLTVLAQTSPFLVQHCN